MSDAQDALDLAEAQRRIETVSMVLLHAQERAAKAERERAEAQRTIARLEAERDDALAHIEAMTSESKCPRCGMGCHLGCSGCRIKQLEAALQTAQESRANERMHREIANGQVESFVARIETLKAALRQWVAEHEINRDGSEHTPESCERFARDRMTGDDCDLAIETRALLAAPSSTRGSAPTLGVGGPGSTPGVGTTAPSGNRGCSWCGTAAIVGSHNDEAKPCGCTMPTGLCLCLESCDPSICHPGKSAFMAPELR